MGLGGILVSVAIFFSVLAFGYLIFKSAAGWGVLHAILICTLFIECWVFLFFAAGVQGFRVKHTKAAAENIQKAEEAAQRTDQLRWGDYNDKNLNAYVPAKSELRRLTTDRGRVWRRVSFIQKQGEGFNLELSSGPALGADNLDADPAAAAAGPSSESLPVDLVVYAFAEEENAEGQPMPVHYLGEYKVVSSQNGAVSVNPSMKLTPTQQQLVNQAGSWTLYELMPGDSHTAFKTSGSEDTDDEIFGHMEDAELNDLFAGVPDARRQSVIERYLRDGTQATDTDPVENIWVQVNIVKNKDINVDNVGDSADASRPYFDPEGQAIDPRLKRGTDDGTVQLTTDMRDQRIVLKEDDAQKLIDSGNAELVKRFFVRKLIDYRQAFSNETIRLQDVLQRIEAYTRARDQMTSANQAGQNMLAEEQTVNTKLRQDADGYSKEVNVLTTAATEAEEDLANLKSRISTMYNNVQNSASL